MRIYGNCYELMSETGRNLWEMGLEVKPKTYQNKVIEGNEDFITKELICEQYCLTRMPDPEWLFVYTKSQEWAAAELKERLSGETLNPGEAWKLRRDMWEQFLDRDGLFDYTYPERINEKTCFLGKDQDIMYKPKIENIIYLLQNDPDTRKAILDIYGGVIIKGEMGIIDADNLDGHKRIPCSMYYDFLIRDNANGEKQLNICYHQRSSDFVQHFGNDVWLAWKLMEYVAQRVGIQPGYLFHTIDSLHCYKKDWIYLKTSLKDIQL